MNSRLIFIFSVLAAFLVSCEDDSDLGSVWDDPKFIRIVAATEKTFSGEEIYYKEGQKIKVWDHSGNSSDLMTNKDKDSVFFSRAWIPDAVPTYAAFPAEDDVVCISEGVFTVSVSTQQNVSVSGEIENFWALGRVKGNNRTSYNVRPLRNITGFVVFDVAFPFIESIRLESLGGQSVTGKVSVNIDKLEKGEADYMSASSSDAVPYVELITAEDGGILNPGTYYAAVLPGDYSDGLQITVKYRYGDAVVKTYFTDGIEISRSSVCRLDDKPIDDDLPDNIKIDLDFTKGWPFVQSPVSSEDQISGAFSGDIYAYNYSYQCAGVNKVKGFPFLLRGNKVPYTYGNGFLSISASNSRITLPSVAGRYIRAVKYETLNSVTYPKGFKLTDMSWNDLAICPQKAHLGSPALLSFPTADGKISGLAASYYMYFMDANNNASRITILYTKQLPSSFDDNVLVESQPSFDTEDFKDNGYVEF